MNPRSNRIASRHRLYCFLFVGLLVCLLLLLNSQLRDHLVHTNEEILPAPTRRSTKRPATVAPPEPADASSSEGGAPLTSDTLAPPSTSKSPKILFREICEIKIAAVGDSITYGNGSHVNKKERDGEGNYPLEVQRFFSHTMTRGQFLRAQSGTEVDEVGYHGRNCSRLLSEVDPRGRCIKYKFSIRNFGRSGRTASNEKPKWSYRHSKEFNASLEYNPDVILILLGTNDSKERHWVDSAQFERHYLGLMKEYLDNWKRRLPKNGVQPDGRVVSGPLFQLLEPPPCTPAKEGGKVFMIDPNVIRSDILPVLRRIGVRTHLPGLEGPDLNRPLMFHESSPLPIFQLFSDRLEEFFRRIPSEEWKKSKGGGLKSAWLHDAVHPTVAGHQLIAQAVVDSLCPQLPPPLW
jgi:lysophospholipase L1-like esterase